MSSSTSQPPAPRSDLLEIELPYGRTPRRLVGARSHIEVLRAVELPPPPALEPLIDDALDQPISSKTLNDLVQPNGRVTVIVSDSTRDEPRAAFLRAIRKRLPSPVRLTIAIATGTHGPCSIAELGIDDELLRGATVVMHDGHSDANLVELGTTSRGTRVRVHRAVVEADLVVATGCIRPHYFAGFGAGIKAIFPGLGQATAIRINHRLKSAPEARAGIVDGNPCRADLAEAVGMLSTPKFLLDGVCAPSGSVQAAVAGDVELAFRAGVVLARPWFSVAARPAPLVIASDGLPVSASLYQAAKIAAAAAPLVAADGDLVIVAECPDGIGPLQTVNEAIFRIGVLPRLATGARISLVSALSRAAVEQTLVAYLGAVPVIERRTLVLPHASHLICEAISP
ncbi:MAG TPA: lactate racemase domain-containing protein [Kofleriaceae bacterium]|jgi:nickel-dependent lactate racemase|nr:lactate racemase domain-containing protein [Kofleriaceae bacterium]